MTRPTLSNAQARRLFLYHHHLIGSPSGAVKAPTLAELITGLGFVQIDSVNTVERAHHMILGARRQTYRPPHLKQLLESKRALFEHWTHDASIIPMQFFPHWRLKFSRDRDRLSRRWETWRGHGWRDKFDDVLKHIHDHGPCTSGQLGADEGRKSGGWWDWTPSKTALEYLWRIGELSVTRREGFTKVYDLTENVIPAEYLNAWPDPDETVDWACASALDRLGFATSGEIAAFWDIITPQEAKEWCAVAMDEGRIVEVWIELADGDLRRVFAWPDLLDRVAALPITPSRLRILSPFDPVLRDRKRAERLFGFRYRIEIFVPEIKRVYGYYVFPILDGDRLIGRIDMKASRADRVLRITAFWPEKTTRIGTGRLARLDRDLSRLARFAGCDRVVYMTDWHRRSG